jgi:hypothetical protein
MPKLIINDKDYYTDDFNQEQIKMYQEISLAQEEMRRMQYLISVLDARCTQLASGIVQIAESTVEDEAKKSTDQETDDN